MKSDIKSYNGININIDIDINIDIKSNASLLGFVKSFFFYYFWLGDIKSSFY